MALCETSEWQVRPVIKKEVSLTVTALYAVGAGLWILLSDSLMLHLALPRDLVELSMIKGWFFVGVTSTLLYLLLRNAIREKDLVEVRAAATQNKLEDHLTRLQRVHSVGALASGVAHDLNNALAPIITAVGLLKLGTMEVQDRELLDTIEASARHGACLVDQILVIGRGRENAGTGLLDPNEIIAEMAHVAKLGTSSSFQVRQELQAAAELVMIEPVQLRQILSNLCTNAVDAMPKGGTLTFSTCVERLEEEREQLPAGDYLRIDVRDTGSGIPEHSRSRIFEPFFTTKCDRGTGLGLATSATIAQRHGGRLLLTSTSQQGTCMTLFLPRAKRACAA